MIAGGLLSALPLIAAIALGLAVFDIIKSWLSPDRDRLQPPGRRGRVRRALDKFPRDPFVWTVFIAAAVACFLLTPSPVMASGAVAGLISSVAAWATSKPRKSMSDRRKWIGAIGRVGAWGIVGILSFFLVLNPLLYAVWLPHETLLLRSGCLLLRSRGPGQE